MHHRSRRERRGPTESGVHSGPSSRPEQSPLPTLAGFIFIARNVASHDGPLSTCAFGRSRTPVADGRLIVALTLKFGII
jgi:hypothetical protein